MTVRLKGRRRRAEQAITDATAWAERQASVSGLVLVGSYALGQPNMASDIDLVVLTAEPNALVDGVTWINGF